MLENDGALRVFEVLVEAHTWSALPQDACQRRLSHLDRFPTQVRAVELQQIEGVEESLRLGPPVPEQLEGGQPPLIAAHHDIKGM